MAGKTKTKTGAPQERTWASTPGTYVAGQANIDGVDKVAIEMEKKWGCDRLRLLVSTEMREKFDRRRYLFNAAVCHGDLRVVAVQYGLSQKGYHKRRKIEQPEMGA